MAMERFIIQTHSGIDSAGKVFGIETRYFIPILCALFASIILFFIISMSAGGQALSIILRILLGFAPLILAITYVGIFFIGRLPHFQEDFFDNLLNGPNFNVTQVNHKENPLMCREDNE